MELDYAAIGGRIKSFRKERRLSQEKLAELIDISVPHMSNVENGKARFSMKIMFNLVNVLKITPDTLLLGYTGRQNKTYPLPVEAIHRELEDCTMDQMVMIEEIICCTRRGLERYDSESKGAGSQDYKGSK